MLGSPLEKDDEEAQAKNGLWALAKYIFKHPATWPVILGAAAAAGWMRPTQPKADDVYWDKTELREIMRSEIAPVRAGMEELAKAQSPRVQVSVLQAMMKADRKNQEVQ
jgi:hypothetical protein